MARRTGSIGAIATCGMIGYGDGTVKLEEFKQDFIETANAYGYIPRFKRKYWVQLYRRHKDNTISVEQLVTSELKPFPVVGD